MDMNYWRLIYDKPRRGAENMAMDDAIITAVGEGNAMPTLRLYAWEPMCLSLGYGQRVREVDEGGLAAHGWDMVRRPTGGRAILHGDEMTYSVSLPIDHELAHGDVVESYRRISLALMEALQRLGLTPRSERQENQVKQKGPVCFEVPSHYEITASGRKLIGSAQVRRKTAILQHGSLPLHGDVGRICEALVYEATDKRSEAKQMVRERATTLTSVMGKTLTWQTVADAVAQGFTDAFGIRFERGELSDYEWGLTDTLLQSTYRNDEWTRKR